MSKDRDPLTSKERGVNFSRKEQEILQELISKYSQILFNKKTDSVTNDLKNTTWTEIHAEFNAISDDEPRTLIQLKNKFENIKRNANRSARAMIKECDDGEEPINPTQKAFDEHHIFGTICPVSLLQKKAAPRPPSSNTQVKMENSIRQRRNLKLRALNKIKRQEEYINRVRLMHMRQRRKEEKEIYELKKKKLNMQIDLLKNRKQIMFNCSQDFY